MLAYLPACCYILAVQGFPNNKGFTLVELALVLVIIGLVIGGVFAGMAVQESANVQRAVKFSQDIDATLNVFYTKFQALPGDIREPQLIGEAPCKHTGPCAGNGNGKVEFSLAEGSGHEEQNVWQHLHAAGLFTRQFNPEFQNYPEGPFELSQFEYAYFGRWGEIAPEEFLITWRRHVLVYSGAASNLQNEPATLTGGITPARAMAIDLKMDDGAPLTGNVMGYFADGDKPSTCLDQAAVGANYNASSSNIDCVLGIRTSL